MIGLNQPGTWFPLIDAGAAGGGGSVSSHIGNAGAVYVSWPTTFSSDRRMKKNIAAPTKDALETVNALAVYSADWTETGPDAQEKHHDFCFMADEVEQQVFPAFCPPADEKSVALINPLHLTAVLWKAVQDLSAKVAALEAAA
jgi:hypothetical protein